MTMVEPVASWPPRVRRRVCFECGAPTPNARAQFCSVEHRREWNNRRAMRGAELYDLIMEWRFNRKKGSTALSLLCNAAGRFNDEDKARGRRSFSSSDRMANINSRQGR